MRKLVLICSVLWIWTCGGDGPTEPKIELPTVQNIEFILEEDTSKTFAFMGSDPLNRALTYSVSTQPQHGTLTINAGAGTYTPNANYHGADTFAYIATNVDGTSNIGTIVATVTPVDDEPNTMDVSATTDEDNAITITVEAEEYDGDNIIFQVRNNCSNCIPTNFSGNTYLYTPNQDWNGTDTFNFEAVDSNAKSVLNVATATITVNPVNDAPTVENIDAGEVKLNESKDITLAGSDVDNDNLTYSIISQPSKGSVTINGNIASYSASIVGEDSFTYQASDGTDTSEEKTVEINIVSFKTFGGSSHETAFDMQVTNDGGFIMAGTTNSFGNSSNGNPDIYVVKTDAQGTEEWSHTYGGELQDEAFSIQQTSDGGFVVAGNTANFDVGIRGMYLIKINSQGVEEWSQTYGGPFQDYAYSVKETSDGGFILAGQTSGFGSNNLIPDDIYVVKTDAQGIEEWSKVFDFDDNVRDGAYDIIQTSDGYFISGFRGEQLYVLKIDFNGNKEWEKYLIESSSYWIKSIQEVDEGYVLAGITNSNRTVVIKLDKDGNEHFRDSISDENGVAGGFFSINNTNDFGYIFAGYYNPDGSIPADIRIIKTDSDLNINWSYTFGESCCIDVGYSAKQTDDGGYVLSGMTSSYGNGGADFILMKFDSQGNQEW